MQLGSGTLTLGGTNSYTGRTIALNGTILLNTASLPKGAFVAGPVANPPMDGYSLTTRGTLPLYRQPARAPWGIGISGRAPCEFEGAGGVTTLSGDIPGVPPASAGFTGDMTVDSGHTAAAARHRGARRDHRGPPLTPMRGLTVNLGGNLTGSGTVNGALTSSRTISPATRPASSMSPGNFTTFGTLNMQIAGTGPPAARRTVTTKWSSAAKAALGGTLNVTFLNGFTPAVGFTATLLQGPTVPPPANPTSAAPSPS